MNIKDKLGKEIIILDGALGTALQKEGLKGGQLSEAFTFNDPETLKKIHRSYIDAGADIIASNTFSANRIKMESQGMDDMDAVKKAVEIAREAADSSERKIFVAQDIGPTGQLMKPIGDMDFDTAYGLFKRQVKAGKDAGADLHFFETFSDVSELKAGVLAAKENSDLPVFCSVTFNEDGRMLLGTDPKTATLMFQDMGIDAIGINCSLGPKEIIPLIGEMLEISKIPVFVQPNAGMPREEDGQTYYDITPREFVDSTLEMIQLGVVAVGGCCGTDTSFISLLSQEVRQLDPSKLRGLSEGWYQKKSDMSEPSACTINSHKVYGEKTVIIGEKINPTGKKSLKQALSNKDYSYVQNMATEQEDAGAHIINLNVGMEGIDEKQIMTDLVDVVSQAVKVPIQIDSSDPHVIETAARYYTGKPIINSVNGEQSSMDKVLPIVKKYGTSVIALTLDERGLPKNTQERLDILDKIISEAGKYEITKDRIIVDPLALTVSTETEAAKATLKAIEIISNEYKMNTVLGASNISFGLPNRDLINRSFLSMAVYAGISSVITDPVKKDYMDEIRGAEVLIGKDKFAEEYICYNNELADKGNSVRLDKQEAEKKSSLQQIIEDGYDDKARQATEDLLKSKKPMEIINEIVIPQLESIGDKYETGEIFLPQMIKSAEAVQETFSVLKPIMAEQGESITKGKILVATVKGDIHDIGKNIVKTVLENYGYEIIDLGKDVDTNVIVNTVKDEGIKFVGLSALMTTTMVNMKTTIDAIFNEGIECKVAVGGAVLTQDYADKIKADFYCESALDTVRAAEKVFEEN